MKRKKWTDREVALLRELYPRPDLFAKDIAARLGRKLPQVYCKAKALGLSRPPEIAVLCGKQMAANPASLATRFHKGLIPPNKGKKLSPEQYARCAPTMFKKGNRPATQVPVGTEVVTTDGYVKVKVADPNKWRLKHHMIWEEHNGPIPKGYNIQFKDRNPLNVAIDNLYIISRADQLKNENSLVARYPEDLQAVIRLRGAVKRSITMHNKKIKDNGKQ